MGNPGMGRSMRMGRAPTAAPARPTSVRPAPSARTAAARSACNTAAMAPCDALFGRRAAAVKVARGAQLITPGPPRRGCVAPRAGSPAVGASEGCIAVNKGSMGFDVDRFDAGSGRARRRPEGRGGGRGPLEGEMGEEGGSGEGRRGSKGWRTGWLKEKTDERELWLMVVVLFYPSGGTFPVHATVYVAE